MSSSTCSVVQASFSEYLDGAVNGIEMQEIARHLDGSGDSVRCEDCAREFASWRSMQEALSKLGPAKPPADLGLKLRLAISREHARRDITWVDRVSLAWDNAVRPMLVHVSGGIAGTVVLVGSILLLLGIVAPSQAVQANDEPLGAITAPHYLYSTVNSGAVVTPHDAPVLVEASVDSHGRVYDYWIVSGPVDDATRTEVANHLLFSVFQPARVFGLPVRGQVLITFSGIWVHA